MKLFVGLGNPGDKYANNRHNIGFHAADRIHERRRFHFVPWKADFQGQIATGRYESEKLLLLKPETYMNNSGQSVGEVARYYKIDPANIYVFHDELDLKPGQIRIKRGGGHGGHNGLRSLDAHIGQDYWRVRLGIGHPGQKDLVVKHVLSDFSQADREWHDALIDAVALAAEDLVIGDIPEFSNQITQAVRKVTNRQQADTRIQKTSINAAPSVPAKTETDEGPMARALRALLPGQKKDD